MKKLFSRKRIRAFTLVELIIVVAVIGILAAMLLPFGHNPEKAPMAPCMSNLKQLDVGFFIWFDDHANRFPWEVSVSKGGTLELIGGGNAFPHFQTISNYGINPKILVCPSDKSRTIATNFAGFSDRNLSYFVNLDTDFTHPSTSIIAGDRHLQTNGHPVKPGLVTLTTNMDIGWTHELHKRGSALLGNLAFADGHVEAVKGILNRTFGAQSVVTNRFAVP